MDFILWQHKSDWLGLFLKVRFYNIYAAVIGQICGNSSSINCTKQTKEKLRALLSLLKVCPFFMFYFWHLTWTNRKPTGHAFRIYGHHCEILALRQFKACPTAAYLSTVKDFGASERPLLLDHWLVYTNTYTHLNRADIFLAEHGQCH